MFYTVSNDFVFAAKFLELWAFLKKSPVFWSYHFTCIFYRKFQVIEAIYFLSAFLILFAPSEITEWLFPNFLRLAIYYAPFKKVIQRINVFSFCLYFDTSLGSFLMLLFLIIVILKHHLTELNHFCLQFGSSFGISLVIRIFLGLLFL